MSSGINSQLEQIQSQVGSKMEETRRAFNEHKQAVGSKFANTGSGWLLPFFLLLVLVAAGFGFAYKKYQDLRKSHLL